MARDDLLELPVFPASLRAEVGKYQHLLPQLDLPEAAPRTSGVDELRRCVQSLANAGLLDAARLIPNTGENLRRFVVLREQIARRALMGDLAFVMQALGTMPLQLAGSDLQKATWLEPALAGNAVSALALSEPDAGSDVAALTCRAEHEGDVYRITGKKHLISNVGAADFYCLFARTGESAGGISCFVVPADAPGLQCVQQVPMSPHPLGELHLNGVAIPEANRIGAEGAGLKLALKSLAHCRPSVAAAANGFAWRALQHSIQHVQSRKAFGGVLADLGAVQAMLADCVTELDAARLLTYRAAWAFDQQPEGRHDRVVSEAKWYATEAAQRIIDRCLQLQGGTGVLQGNLLAELYMAIRPLRIYEGASEVQQQVIASALLKEFSAS